VNVRPTLLPGGLKLTGEIDASNSHLLRPALAEHGRIRGLVHLDLSEVSFCDVSGIRAIVSYAAGLDGDHRLLLHGLPAQIEKVMNVIGWGELSGIEFCRCTLET
jgi:anti-anti-sigma factor